MSIDTTNNVLHIYGARRCGQGGQLGIEETACWGFRQQLSTLECKLDTSTA